MAYKRGADGVVKKGKTDVKNLGSDGSSLAGMKGGKKSAGVTTEAMKKLGRGLARVANQG